MTDNPKDIYSTETRKQASSRIYPTFFQMFQRLAAGKNAPKLTHILNCSYCINVCGLLVENPTINAYYFLFAMKQTLILE